MNFLKKDLKEEARIARRRQFEQERKLRIFNPRQRLIGVDVQGLETQRREKQIQAESEKQKDEEYSRKLLEYDKICCGLEEQIEKQRRNLAKEINNFHDQYQQNYTRREFDLNDPNFKKKLRNTVISFEGEDQTSKERSTEQKKQNRAWLLQQIEEKREIAKGIKDMNEEIARRSRCCGEMAKRLANIEDCCRKKIDEATAEFNKLSASEKAEIKKSEADKEAKVEAEEIENWMKGDFLNENPERARSAFGPGRVIAMMYKGEPPEKEFETKKFQQEQAFQYKVRTHQEEDNHKAWENFNEGLYRQAFEKERQLIAEQRMLNDRITHINSGIAYQHSMREADRNDIRDLHPTSKFFDQFNRTSY